MKNVGIHVQNDLGTKHKEHTHTHTHIMSTYAFLVVEWTAVIGDLTKYDTFGFVGCWSQSAIMNACQQAVGPVTVVPPPHPRHHQKRGLHFESHASLQTCEVITKSATPFVVHKRKLVVDDIPWVDEKRLVMVRIHRGSNDEAFESAFALVLTTNILRQLALGRTRAEPKHYRPKLIVFEWLPTKFPKNQSLKSMNLI